MSFAVGNEVAVEVPGRGGGGNAYKTGAWVIHDGAELAQRRTRRGCIALASATLPGKGSVCVYHKRRLEGVDDGDGKVEGGEAREKRLKEMEGVFEL